MGVDGERGSLEISDQELMRVFEERQPERIEHFLGVIPDEVAPPSAGRSQRQAPELVVAACRPIATGEPVGAP